MENSWQIEKMFNQDNSRLKRIGANVHRRTGKGSDRAGVAGGVRFAKTKFKKYEKNSRVSTSNMYEDILPFKEFKKLETETQAELMEEWLKRHSKSKIREEMHVSYDRLNSIIGGFELEKIMKDIASEGGVTVTNTKYTLDEAKREVISKHDLYEFDEADRYEIVHYYNKVLKVNNRELAEKWNIKDAASLGSMKTNWKKKFIEEGRSIEEALKPVDDWSKDEPDTVAQSNKGDDPFSEIIKHKAGSGKSGTTELTREEAEGYTRNTDDVIAEVIENDEDVSEKINEFAGRDNENTIKQAENRVNRMESEVVSAFKGQYKGYQLKEKLQGVIYLLESNKTYDVNLSVQQIEDGGSNEELMDMLRRLVSEIK